MSGPLLIPLCSVLILATSALATFPFAYPDLNQPPLSFGPHLIYGSGIDGTNGDLTGFSYFTKDFGGGQSEVVFFTGPNSDTKMNDEMATMKDQMSSSSPTTIAETKVAKDNAVANFDATNNQDASTIAPLVPVETKESSTSANTAEETASTTAKPKEEDKKEPAEILDINNGQWLPEKVPGFETPYPILRLAGSASFYPQLPTSLSGFAGFGSSDYFKSQNVPFYNHFNSYQSPYDPFYPSADTDYYNPAVFPTIYQNPIIPSFSNFIPLKPHEGLKKNPFFVPALDKRIGFSEELSATPSAESFHKKVGEDSSTVKEAELPTSTEQAVEKATTVSETSPTTAEDIKETTTGAVKDAVAVA